MTIVFLLVALFAADYIFGLPANQERAFDIETIRLDVREVPPSASLEAFDFEAARKGKSGGTATAGADTDVEDRAGKTEEKKEGGEEMKKEEKMEDKMEEKKEETKDEAEKPPPS